HEERAAGDGPDARVGRAPAELFGDFEAESLRAFGVVGADVDVDERPVVGAGEFGAEAVDGVVVATDLDEGGAVDTGAEDLSGLEVVGDEDNGFHTGGGGMGAYAVGEVTGAGAGELFVSKFAGAGACDGDDAVLERPRGVDGVVLDVEVGQAERLAEVFRVDEGGEAGADVDRGMGAQW